MEHYENCEAPICAGDPNPNYKKEVLWYPGELVCRRGPYQRFQKQQSKINRYVAKGQFKYPGYYFTASMLESRQMISRGLKGGNPDLEEPPKGFEGVGFARKVPPHSVLAKFRFKKGGTGSPRHEQASVARRRREGD